MERSYCRIGALAPFVIHIYVVVVPRWPLALAEAPAASSVVLDGPTLPPEILLGGLWHEIG